MDQEYSSGLGKESVVPEEIKGWSWGAFLLNWVWGLGNSTYIALLMFVPLVNIVMLFVLGFKGNEWAWRNRIWRDVDHFKATQRKWRNFGIGLVLVVLPTLFWLITGMLKGEAYDMSIDAVRSDAQVVSMVGNDPQPGFFVVGQIIYGASGGSAKLNYTLEGDKGSAEVYVWAEELTSGWHLKQLVLVDPETNNQLWLIGQGR